MATHHQVLIIGGGTGGIMAAAQLKKQQPQLTIGLIDPAETHYYQPAWTLVGANTYKFEDTARPMKSLIPKGVNWIKEYANKFEPEQNKVITKNGNEYLYDYLVVCPGLKNDTSLVEGLSEAIDKGVVCSNYTDPKHTWEVIKNFKGGTALFTQPTTPIKCGGAPQKIMYLAAEAFKRNGVHKKTNIVFATPGTVIFGIKSIAKTLMEVVDRHDISLNFGYKLVAVDGKAQIAWYEMADHEKYYNKKDNIKVIKDGDRIGIKFDMMHLAPPQTAPEFIKNSPFALDTGWMNVDKHTLQSPDYRNVFGLGDVCGLPTAKTGAAIRKQTPIVVANILKLMEINAITNKQYNGYSSCPLVTGYGKMVLAEFDYDQNFTPDPKLKQMLVFNSDKEHWRLWMLKKYILPYLYWNKMMKGIDV
ncbi:MAG: pyridine nucleotide-disulfide oxidoreductase [Saprospiraceae bacterium]|nr:MAG: pyridine nucleotide-disulfide oxidoreductase [Saprospiraceae bacterium]